MRCESENVRDSFETSLMYTPSGVRDWSRSDKGLEAMSVKENIGCSRRYDI